MHQCCELTYQLVSNFWYLRDCSFFALFNLLLIVLFIGNVYIHKNFKFCPVKLSGQVKLILIIHYTVKLDDHDLPMLQVSTVKLCNHDLPILPVYHVELSKKDLSTICILLNLATMTYLSFLYITLNLETKTYP